MADLMSHPLKGKKNTPLPTNALNSGFKRQYLCWHYTTKSLKNALKTSQKASLVQKLMLQLPQIPQFHQSPLITVRSAHGKSRGP